MCVISDEMAYREYLEGREESADILVADMEMHLLII